MFPSNWLVQRQSNLCSSCSVQVPGVRVSVGRERGGGGVNISLCRTLSPSVEPELPHYTDFDCKVIDYMSRLERQDHVKTEVAQAKLSRLNIEMILPSAGSRQSAGTIIINIKVTFTTLNFKG